MASININTVVARYQEAFGYIGGNYSNAMFGRLVKLPVYDTADSQPATPAESQLYPVAEVSFANVKLVNEKTGKSYAFGIGEAGEDYMAPPLMISFSRGKNVVRTAIDRSETEVIEHFGLKPWTINIQGIIIDTNEHKYPSDLLKKVNEIFSSWGTYKVESEIFLDLDITTIFFDDDFQIGFVEGFADTVKFSMRAISVLPVEVRTKGE